MERRALLSAQDGVEAAGGSSHLRLVVYQRRWLMLALFALYCTVSAAQWIQYAIIADVIVRYYGVSYSAVDWTSMVYMVAYVITIIPATWFFNKMGLRISILLGTGGTCIGAWIKVFSVAPDLFWLGFLGQTVVAASQTFVLSIPAALAAIWFGADQVATACAIGVFGVQFGSAVGFFLPTFLVPNGSPTEIENGLTIMFYTVAISCTIILVFQLLFLESRPPTPPSAAQAQRESGTELTVRDFLAGLVTMVRNRNFALILISFSINVAVFSAVTTFLNQMLLIHYPQNEENVGLVGAALIVSGLVGTVVVGVLVDRTQLFKEINVVIYAVSALAMVAYTFILPTKILYIFIVASFFGFFVIGYIPASLELAAEVTYPEAEATMAGVMSLSCQVLAVLFTLGYGWLLQTWGDLVSNLAMAGALLLGTLLTALVAPDLRRQRAGQRVV